MSYLKKNLLDEKFFHIGPPRDFDLFLDFKKNKTKTLKKALIYCVQVYLKNKVRDLNYYKELLKIILTRK